jgi:hypothetical protein
VRTDPKKVEAVAAMPFPKDAAGVRSFLGMTGYYANFIKDYATKASSLFASTAQKYLWCVTSTMRDAFQALKTALLADPVLRQPDFVRPFVLTTDWSEEAQGAVLGQLDDADNTYAVQYASRRNTPAESHYAPSHGECIAIIYGITKFQYYRQGHKFHLKTDALQWLHTAQFGSPKLAGWSLQLQEYDFTVAHRGGDHNVVADHLSRMDPLDPSPLPTLAAASVFRDDDFRNHAQYESAFACTICNRTAWFKYGHLRFLRRVVPLTVPHSAYVIRSFRGMDLPALCASSRPLGRTLLCRHTVVLLPRRSLHGRRFV